MKTSTANVNPEFFVRTWQRAKSIDEVCKIFNIEKCKLSNLATRYRKKGVKLKHFCVGNRVGNTRFDIDKLSSLAKKCLRR